MSQQSKIQKLEEDSFISQQLDVEMLRLDLLHPIVSGNKFFKLKYYIKDAVEKKNTGIVTFGGYHSNHLVAAAFTCKEKGLNSVCLIRGEKPNSFSNCLHDCIEYGMEIKFLSRNDFDALQLEDIEKEFPSHTIIPQGGYGKLGAKGASEILSTIDTTKFNYILASCGTGTMAAGLLNSCSTSQNLLLFSALKNNFSVLDEINELRKYPAEKKNFQVLFNYHFGGYAKKNKHVFDTMNHFYEVHQIPTDFVYTGKMITAFYDLLNLNFFPKNSNILFIHSGGLQGNRSLKNNELIF
jgi:hypothetical protein